MQILPMNIEQHQASQCIYLIASLLVFFNARCFDIVQREQIFQIKMIKKKVSFMDISHTFGKQWTFNISGHSAEIIIIDTLQNAKSFGM